MSKVMHKKYWGLKEDGSIDKEGFHKPEDLEKVGFQILREISTDDLIILPEIQSGTYQIDSMMYCKRMESLYNKFKQESAIPEIDRKEFEQIYAEIQVIGFEMEEQGQGKNTDIEDEALYMMEALYVELYTDIDTINIEE